MLSFYIFYYGYSNGVAWMIHKVGMSIFTKVQSVESGFYPQLILPYWILFNGAPKHDLLHQIEMGLINVHCYNLGAYTYDFERRISCKVINQFTLWYLKGV